MDHGRLALVVAAAAMAMACTVEMRAAAAAPQPLAPCMYVFGDSLVDNGNNNGILSLARANYRPYGIDFHEGPPGRFTNGRTMVDFLSDMLGLRPPLLPAYAVARPADLARGVNFASGASGIRAETGNNLGEHYPLSEQVVHFRTAVSDMGRTAGFSGNATKVMEHLGRCIFFVGMGSNDYLNNYFMPDYYDTAQVYDPHAYATLLLQDYSSQLADLYDLGARKFVVVGVGQIGCIPYELARMNNDNQPSGPDTPSDDDDGIVISIGGGGGGRSSSTSSSNASNNSTTKQKPTPDAGACNDTINRAIAIYNNGLLSMVKRFNRGQQLRGAKFVFLDTVHTGMDLAVNAAAHGFTVLDRGCCGVGRNNGQITCLPLQRPCDDRSKYIFWDAFHPTEAANRIYAAKAFNSTSTSDAYPINISQLAAI
ncbi:GDSL esterase/lipase At1g33811-like [Phragmites australis]|uniref:GDSL esterase/lipase At1g33811-like n=1 Tax=Phragmites australis TaxID=29695 RepID=UPI002D783E2D|nr:GDSL esterase/lipase At1g33811-like [Phragmites australis]